MNNFLQNSVFFGVFISIITYEIGVLIKKKLKIAIFNPLLISMALIIIFLLIFFSVISHFYFLFIFIIIGEE